MGFDFFVEVVGHFFGVGVNGEVSVYGHLEAVFDDFWVDFEGKTGFAEAGFWRVAFDAFFFEQVEFDSFPEQFEAVFKALNCGVADDFRVGFS